MASKISGLGANSMFGIDLPPPWRLIFSLDGLAMAQSATAATAKNRSQLGEAITASYISLAETTSVRWIFPVARRGVSNSHGPAIKCTSAPASRAALAIAKPILPELRLVMPRTGSIASNVGPAVINTRLPASTFFWKKAINCSVISAGSSILPIPTSPQAWAPLAGPSNSTRSLRKRSALRTVAGCCHICKFIAGAKSKGQSRARHRVVRRSSARPRDSLAIKSALAGAIKIASAARDNSMCAILLLIRASHWFVNTGLPVKACMVTGVMNWVAASVMTTWTLAPSCISRRASSADL